MNKENLETLLKQDRWCFEDIQSEGKQKIIEGHEFTCVRYERINSSVEFVFSILFQSEPVTYWRQIGNYDSYNGADFSYSDIKQVKPIQVTVTEFHTV